VSSRFSDHLRRLADPIWQSQLQHPFVKGIGDGSLDLDKFRFWILQDYRFLIEYCRLLALAAARAPDLETLTLFADLLMATARTEMDLHRALAAEFGIGPADLEAAPMAPTTKAYTDFLVRTSSMGDFAELAAALLPCMWAFSEIGLSLAAGSRPADARFAAWIDSYASPEFQALADWCRRLVDRMGGESSGPVRKRMETAFLVSSQYELAFWQMAWTAQP
jgi:thiaminase/transcriptional activator TenA